MDFFNDAFRLRVSQLHKDIFDTWKRGSKIRFFKTPKEVYVFDPALNSDFDQFVGENNLKVEESQEFDVCLRYLDRQEQLNFIGGEDTGIRFRADYNRIGIQVEYDAFLYLQDTVRFVFEGETYITEDPWRKLGMF